MQAGAFCQAIPIIKRSVLFTVLLSEAPVVGSSGWEHKQQHRDGDGHTGVSYEARTVEKIKMKIT